MKHCTKCNTTKSLDDFYKNKTSRDGRNTYCKCCWNHYMREQNRKHKDRRAAAVAAWYRRNKQHKAEISAQWRAKNKHRIRFVQAQYRANNKQELMHKRSQWAADNPHLVRANAQRQRAKRHNAPVYTITLKDLIRVLTSPCAIPECANSDIEMDHIIPLSRGGTHGIGNLQSLCSHHNRTKHNKTMVEYRALLMRQQQRAA